MNPARVRLSGDHSAYHAGSAAAWAQLRHALGPALVDADQPFDTLVLNGEGTMHHGTASFRRKMDELRAALDAGKRAWLVNTVWQDNPADHDDVLHRLERIVVRERRSRDDLLARHGIAAEVALDQSYFREVAPPATPPGDFAGQVVYTDFYLPPVQAFVRLSEGKRASFPHFSLRDGDWDWAVASLRGARLLVTGRHHAVYAACRARTPFVAIPGNSHKIEGLLETAGVDIPVCRDLAMLDEMIGWAGRNGRAYRRLFDWMEAQAPWSPFGAPNGGG